MRKGMGRFWNWSKNKINWGRSQSFTCFSSPVCQHWEFAPNSVHYLLSLWQRLAASVPYVKATEPHLLETYTPEVTKAYITSRLESVHVILRWACLKSPLSFISWYQFSQNSKLWNCVTLLNFNFYSDALFRMTRTFFFANLLLCMLLV